MHQVSKPELQEPPSHAGSMRILTLAETLPYKSKIKVVQDCADWSEDDHLRLDSNASAVSFFD